MLALQHRALGLRGVPTSTVIIAAVLSAGGLSAAQMLGLPIWLVGLATVIPWLPVLVLDVRWVAERYQITSWPWPAPTRAKCCGTRLSTRWSTGLI
jgi:hypothetical protein